ncbi:hypothetical protein [Streptomyces rochei]|uniref:hypothetical protein n=1 Tax=Streptomyces rochei TaxID=1928 RepID=UPI0033A54113
MADEQDRWLDRETAEILLRGESLEAVDPAARDRAERLAEALGALAAAPAPTSEEMPGEAAALAAFRKVRAERADEAAAARSGRVRGAAAPPADAGLIRIGPRDEGSRRPRRRRPLHLGLAAALTVGMVGGVAVAAANGVLPRPFPSAGPDTAVTGSAAASPDRPTTSPSPLDGLRDGSIPTGPTSGTTGAPGRDGSADGTAGDTGADRDSADGTDRPALTASCRDVRAGRDLGDVRERALKEAAGGSSKVDVYCRNLLAGTGTADRERAGGRDAGEAGDAARDREPRPDAGGGKSGKGDKGDKGDKGSKGDQGEDDGNGGKGDRDGKGGGKGGAGKDGKDDDADDGGHIAPPAAHPGPTAPSLRPRPQWPALSHPLPALGDTRSDLRLSQADRFF